MAENGYIGRQPNDSSAVIARQQYAPTGDTSVFAFAAGYDTGYVDVYMNGVRLLEGRDFSAGDGNNIYLTEDATSNDLLEVVAYKAFNPESAVTYTESYSGAKIGIQSSSILIGAASTLNFVGSGNTFAVNGDTIDISISSGAGGALGERLSEDENNPKYKIYRQKKELLVDQTIAIDPSEVGADYGDVVYVAETDVRVTPGSTMTIGAGITFRGNILGIFT